MGILSSAPGRRIGKGPASILIAVLVFALVVGLRGSGALKQLELSAYDLLYPALAALAPPRQPRRPGITLVWVDDRTERRFGAVLPDRELSKVLGTVLDKGARLVGIDLYRDRPVPGRQGDDGHAGLRQRLRERDQIIAIYRFKGVEPPPVLRGSERIGFSDFVYDEGGIVRRGLLNLDDGENLHFSFALVLALHYLADRGVTLGVDPVQPGNWLLGETDIAALTPDFGGYVDEDARGFQYLLDYRIDERRFKELSIAKLLDGDYSPADFQDRIVIVGSRSETAKDYFFTPSSRWRSGDQRVFGATIQAIAALQLIDIGLGARRPLRSFGEPVEYTWVLLWVLAGVAVVRGGTAMGSYLVGMLVALVLLVASALWALQLGWWIPLVPPALGFLGAAGLLTLWLSALERRERREIMQLFARRVSPAVAEMYWEQRGDLLREGRLAPRQLTATVLFTDLKNFTRVSEHADPGQLMEWLNDYMESMVDEVFAHGGQLDKIIGDAVMAVFGVPFGPSGPADVARDANSAVRCALAMAQRMREFNDKWIGRGFPSIGMRIGICTGELVAGTLGSAQRQEYTVIGDTVNTASRLESYDKTLAEAAPCRILLAESTVGLLEPGLDTETVGAVALKGKQRRITVHMLRGPAA